MRIPLPKSAKFLLKAAVSVTLLALLFRQIPIENVWGALVRIDPALCALSIAVTLLTQVVAAHQVRLVLAVPDVHLPFGRIFITNMRVKFYSLFLPGYLGGGLLRWYYLSKDNKLRAQVAAALGFNRMMEFSVLCAVGAVCWALYGDSRLAPFAPLVAIAAVIPVFLFAALWNTALLGMVGRLLEIRFWPSWAASRIRKVIASMQTYPHADFGRLGLIALVCLARHGLVLLSLYSLVLALDIEVSILMLAIVRLCLDVLLMLPVSLSGLGVREVSYVFLLGLVAVPAEAAVALGLAMYAKGLLFALLGGCVEFHHAFLQPHAVRGAEGRS